MGYATLAQCLNELEATGQLRRIDAPVSPHLELAAIQRRAFAAKAPALLFTNVAGTPFPMLANLFGTRERLEFVFRHSLRQVEAVIRAKADPAALLKKPLSALPALPGLVHMLPKKTRNLPVLECQTSLDQLPKLVGWPRDGGPFITLPLVYSEDPDRPGLDASNLGMYRVQLAGNDYAANEVGLHYQLHRGIGVHHAHALARGQRLPVHVYVGGPPALAVAAVMPLPEGLSELRFAGLLGGARTGIGHVPGLALPVLAQADFCITGFIAPDTKPEGPFGDHVGYYSLRHDFPVLTVTGVYHRKDAVWPFTSVGRPPQEDTIFGDFIHSLTSALVPQVFHGIRQVHAVDAAGVHPLLLAIGSERYTPYEGQRQPRELLTQAMHLLGTTQTSLAKYVLIAAQEDAPALNCRDVPAFLRHMLERTDLARDLHFITNATCDTLDYSGYGLHQGSRLIWASCGGKRRELGHEMPALPDLPNGFGHARLATPGIVLVQGPEHTGSAGESDPAMQALADALTAWPCREAFPLLVVVDDSAFCASDLANFLWVAFTRSDPATDIYGPNARTRARHWACDAPLLLDARRKPFHAPPLEEDPETIRRIEALAAPAGPLHGLF